MFQDRIDAGVQLAEKLKKYRGDASLILSVPRGGVPIAYAVAEVLSLPVEIILTKKIGHPENKELAIGAASLSDHFVLPEYQVSKEYITETIQKVRSNLREMYIRFMGRHEPMQLKGKTVIVVDDGVATGNTLLATVRLLRKKNPAKIIIGVPVASRHAVELLEKEADEVVAVLVPDMFRSVSNFYEDFTQVSDEDVLYYLNKLREKKIPVT